MTAFVTTAHIYSQKSHTDGVLKGLWGAVFVCRYQVLYLVYAVPPISWQRSRLIVWKVCKTENLERFMALYSSIMFKGRTDRDSLKGGYEKFIDK